MCWRADKQSFIKYIVAAFMIYKHKDKVIQQKYYYYFLN